LTETKEKQSDNKHTYEKWEKVNKNKRRKCRTAQRLRQAGKAIGGPSCAFEFSWSVTIQQLRCPAAGQRTFSPSDAHAPKTCLSRVCNDTIHAILSLDDHSFPRECTANVVLMANPINDFVWKRKSRPISYGPEIPNHKTIWQ
jgi:hypothetical protein